MSSGKTRTLETSVAVKVKHRGSDDGQLIVGRWDQLCEMVSEPEQIALYVRETYKKGA